MDLLSLCAFENVTHWSGGLGIHIISCITKVTFCQANPCYLLSRFCANERAHNMYYLSRMWQKSKYIQMVNNRCYYYQCNPCSRLSFGTHSLAWSQRHISLNGRIIQVCEEAMFSVGNRLFTCEILTPFLDDTVVIVHRRGWFLNGITYLCVQCALHNPCVDYSWWMDQNLPG